MVREKKNGDAAPPPLSINLSGVRVRVAPHDKLDAVDVQHRPRPQLDTLPHAHARPVHRQLAAPDQGDAQIGVRAWFQGVGVPRGVGLEGQLYGGRDGEDGVGAAVAAVADDGKVLGGEDGWMVVGRGGGEGGGR